MQFNKLFLFVFILLGLFFLWLGLKPTTQVAPPPLPSPVTQPVTEATSSGVASQQGERVLVVKVIDGDTIELLGGLRVRYIGVDTPETKDPRRPVECFGKEAAFRNKELVEGKEVILEKDVSETDKYNRLLRYIYLPLSDGNLLFINDYLVREGYATSLSYPPDIKFTEQFLKAQEEAKIGKKGLWGKC